MGKSSPHNSIIKKAARDALLPLGLHQVGRSRFFYSDEGWYAIAVEFQPSKWGPATFLNVGVMWLWIPHHGWTFDLGHRVHGEVKYRNQAQFTSALVPVVELAVQRVKEIRSFNRDLYSALEAAAVGSKWELGFAGLGPLRFVLLSLVNRRSISTRLILNSIERRTNHLPSSHEIHGRYALPQLHFSILAALCDRPKVGKHFCHRIDHLDIIDPGWCAKVKSFSHNVLKRVDDKIALRDWLEDQIDAKRTDLGFDTNLGPYLPPQ